MSPGGAGGQAQTLFGALACACSAEAHERAAAIHNLSRMTWTVVNYSSPGLRGQCALHCSR